MIFGQSLQAQKINSFTINGYVKEEGSGELLPGVTVYIPELRKGVVTNSYGFYSMTVEAGNHKISYSFVGYETVTKDVELDQDIELDVSIKFIVTGIR